MLPEALLGYIANSWPIPLIRGDYMNTDEMYGNKPLYAYVNIGIRRKIAFPLYLRRQRIQGKLHDLFRIECYSEEEVSWYIQMCNRLSHWLVLL